MRMCVRACVCGHTNGMGGAEEAPYPVQLNRKDVVRVVVFDETNGCMRTGHVQVRRDAAPKRLKTIEKIKQVLIYYYSCIRDVIYTASVLGCNNNNNINTCWDANHISNHNIWRHFEKRKTMRL